MSRLYRWTRENSLWLVSIGLMLASSGLDGVYMGKWMPGGWAWLGLVLNTMSDVANMVLMYWFGRLRQQPKGSLRYRLAGALLPAELVAILYGWFFSWRQLRAILPGVEPADWQWVSAVAAGFIPLLLAFIGYAQSLLAGKLEVERASTEATTAHSEQPAESPKPQRPAELRRLTRSEWREFLETLNGDGVDLTPDRVNELLVANGFAAVPYSTARDWAGDAPDRTETDPLPGGPQEG